MDVTKMPIIGKVTTKVLTYTISYPDGRKEPYDMPAETYSVVDVYEHNGHKFYVTNIWHKEHKRSPLTIVDDIVEKYESFATAGKKIKGGFDDTTTGLKYRDDHLKYGSKIIKIAPDDFIKSVQKPLTPEMRKHGFKDIDPKTDKKVQKIIKLINQGVKIHALYWDKTNILPDGVGFYDGIHRALAAIELGIKEVPVLVVENKKASDGKVTGSKIPMREIIIHWADGKDNRFFPKRYTDWSDANTDLSPLVEWGSYFTRDYNKSKFTVVFQDGESYEGILHISEREDNPLKTKNVIGKHIKENLESKTDSTAKHWLSKYDFGTEQQAADGVSINRYKEIEDKVKSNYSYRPGINKFKIPEGLLERYDNFILNLKKAGESVTVRFDATPREIVIQVEVGEILDRPLLDSIFKNLTFERKYLSIVHYSQRGYRLKEEINGGYTERNKKFAGTNIKSIPVTKLIYADGGLIAPNGKPSNLTPEQYRLVRTSAFKKWFGEWDDNSKNSQMLLDDNGEPLVLWRGDDVDFNAFDISKNLSGKFWFVPSEEYASSRGRYVKPYFIKSEEKIDLRYANGRSVLFDDKRSDNPYSIYITFGLGSDFDEYVCYNPLQIKLADGSNTTFDGNNPDIRYKNGGLTMKKPKSKLLAPNGKPSNLTPEQYRLVRTTAFKKWFGDWENSPETASKVVDSNGEPLICYHGSNKQNINTFDIKKIGTVQYSDWGSGFYFTPSKSTAYYYSAEAQKQVDKKYNDAYEKYERTQSNKDLKEFQNIGRKLDEPKTPIIYEVFLDVKKPLRHRIDELDGFLSNYAKEKLRDGIFIMRSVNPTSYDEIIVFESTQIKLADGTNTTFDGSNPDIRFGDGGTTKNQKYYRAVSEDMGLTTTFVPTQHYEAFDDDGSPITHSGTDVFVMSKTPEVSASKTIGGAVLGLWSMFNQYGINPINKKIYIYEINDKPKKDLSHIRMADFEYLKEVRYNKAISGKRVGYFVYDDSFQNNALNFYGRISDDDPYLMNEYDVDAWEDFERYILTLSKSHITKYDKGGRFDLGGDIPERYKEMGFSKVGEKKKSTRPEKKWMVLAKKDDKYKVVHGGYKGMEDYTQHKDKERRKRFWNRMGGFDSPKANDPFSPLYWHKKFGTWADGGPIESEYVTYKELTYPSGSTLDFYKGRIYLIGDDAKYISILDTNFNEIDTIPLFEHDDHRIPKKEKRDIETSTIIQINGQDILALIGSGSRKKRRRIYLVPLNTKKVINKEISVVKYGKFIDKLLSAGINEVNIEGSTLINDYLLLSNRGNKANPSNYLIATRKGFWLSPAESEISLIKLNLPDGLGISELAYHNGILFFTASVENTSNAFDDGEIGDSYLGCVVGIDILIGKKSVTPDQLINLAEYDEIFAGHKIEGICIENSDNGHIIDLVSDNDDGKSTMFKIKLDDIYHEAEWNNTGHGFD